jgi:hypothetical protein
MKSGVSRGTGYLGHACDCGMIERERDPDPRSHYSGRRVATPAEVRRGKVREAPTEADLSPFMWS